MTGAARCFSELPDRHVVLRRPWWAREHTTPDSEADPLSDLVSELADRQPWMREGLCASSGDPDAWFPERGTRPEHTHAALRICGHCPVRITCMRWALTHHPVLGIWGGTTYHERRKALEDDRKAAQ